MASVTPAHQLPVLYNDLQPAESLHDVLHTLDHLSYIVNEIFTRVDTRIEQERLRITQIKHRVAVCGQKVSQIKGSKQAITVFSTAKFPAPKSLPAYPTLFGEIDEVSIHCTLVFFGYIVVLNSVLWSCFLVETQSLSRR